jgi:hypothetical protein
VPPARLFVVSTLGLVWHPVDLATPDRAAPRGQPSTQLPANVAQSQTVKLTLPNLCIPDH